MLGISIVVTSGKGGTGKTTCTAAIAQALAGLGNKVLAIDCDIGLKNLDLAMGLTDDAVWDFSDVISGRVEAQSAIIPHPDIENLFFLSAPSDMLSDDVDPALFSSLIKSAKSDYDYILMDSPAGLGSGFRLAASSADMAILVSTWDAASLRDGQKTVGILRRIGVGDVKLIVVTHGHGDHFVNTGCMRAVTGAPMSLGTPDTMATRPSVRMEAPSRRSSGTWRYLFSKIFSTKTVVPSARSDAAISSAWASVGKPG